MNYSELQQLIVKWGEEKGILAKGTPMGQAIKTLEEVNELLAAINNGDQVEIKDALGDILVTIILQAELQQMDLVDCLESAYNIISKRNGKMVDGVFVKND